MRYKKIYTEIESYCGGSACLMLQHDYETELNLIDPLHVLPNQSEILTKNILKFNKIIIIVIFQKILYHISQWIKPN
jgi:hypothetical protein